MGALRGAGGSGSGKSTVMNVMLLLTECDESTYASADHHRGTPCYVLQGAPYQYEALGVIRQLLLDDDVPVDRLQAVMDERVEMKSPAAVENARHAVLRAEAQKNIYDPLADFTFNGVSAFMRYVHPAGDRCNVTTRVATADRYGTRYHACAQFLTEDALRLRLHAFLMRERELRPAGSTPAAYRKAVSALEPDEQKERQLFFMTWNACVHDSLALGDKERSANSFLRYERQLADDLPMLFTCAGPPTLDDIELHADIQPHLGKFLLFAGRGKQLHLDRDFIAGRLHKLTGADTREAFALKKLWAFGPWALLQGGKEVVDAPGTSDKTLLHRQQLKEACRDAKHIILFHDRNIVIGDTLDCMSEFGVLRRFLDSIEQPAGDSDDGDGQRLQLSIVHNHEHSCRGLELFRKRNKVIEDEGRRLSIDGLLGKLSAETDMDLDVLRREVESRVRVYSVYTLLYAGLKLFPERAAQLEDLQEILAETQGAQLLGLLEELNLERVTFLVEGLHTGPLANAREAVAARLARTEQQLPENQRLRDAAAKLIKPRPNSQHYKTRVSLRTTLSQQFEPISEDAPRGAMKAELDAAYASFCGAFDEHFVNAREVAKEHWEMVRPRFLKPKDAAKAREAHAALAHGTPPPQRMDLHDVLWYNVELPAAPFEELMAGLDNSLTLCEDACCSLLNEQLVAVAGNDEPQAVLARRLIESEFSVEEGRQILHEKLARVCAKLSRYRVVVLLNKVKKEAMKIEIGDKTPLVTELDPAGIATLVDGRLDAVLNRVLARFKLAVRDMLDNLCEEAETALKPVQERQHRQKTVPAMEEYIDAALAYVVAALDPDTHDTRLEALRSARARGDDAASRVGAVVTSLRAVLHNPGVLGAAAERYLDTLTLLRLAHAEDADALALARPEQLLQRNNGPLPRPHNQLRKLNLGYTGPEAFAAALASAGVARHIGVVEAGLAAVAPEPLAVHRLPKAPAGESLWYALAHQLFSLTPERNPAQLKRIVLAQMLHYYGAASRRRQFQIDTGVELITYLDELRNGTRAGGLLELYFTAFVYTGVQVCVWVAAAEAPASVPLLVFHGKGAPADRCYNLVLEEGRYGFCSVSKLHRGAASVSWAFVPPTLHTYALLPGEARGLNPVSVLHRRQRSADDDGDSAGTASQRLRTG